MKKPIAFFLPTRKGSERVKNKNTRPFAGIQGGLMENKIRQLVASKLLVVHSRDIDCEEDFTLTDIIYKK